MTKLILIGFGGAIGTVFRYLLSGIVYQFSNGTFPWGTLCVNLAGSFIIGVLWGLWEFEALHPQTRNFIFIGVLGGFTTFSTYTLESVSLLRDGEIRLALSNVLASNILGIALVLSGILIAKYCVNFIR